MEYQPMELPFGRESLEPHMSAETLSFHYDKHHFAYAGKLNTLVDEADRVDVIELINKARADGNIPVEQNASQLYNHDFFWKSLSGEGQAPSAELLAKIEAAFGSLDDFKAQFKAAALGVMGSGWVWLVADGDELKIVTTGAAETVAGTSLKPLLTLDVWEHAYYIDYRNRRPDFTDAFLDNLANWSFAEAQLAA